MCQHHFQSRENEPCHVLCSSCPYFEVGVARTVRNSHVIVFCSIPLAFSKFGVLRTVNGAACLFQTIYVTPGNASPFCVTLGSFRHISATFPGPNLIHTMTYFLRAFRYIYLNHRVILIIYGLVSIISRSIYIVENAV